MFSKSKGVMFCVILWKEFFKFPFQSRQILVGVVFNLDNYLLLFLICTPVFLDSQNTGFTFTDFFKDSLLILNKIFCTKLNKVNITKHLALKRESCSLISPVKELMLG